MKRRIYYRVTGIKNGQEIKYLISNCNSKKEAIDTVKYRSGVKHDKVY